VPDTVAAHVAVCVVRIVPGVQFTLTPVMVEAAFTVTAEDPVFVASCVDVAVMVAVPAPDGVNTPAAVIAPPVADHVTPVLKLPVPVTLAAHADVCVVAIALGAQLTLTDEMVETVGEAVTVTAVDPDFVAS